MPVLTLDEYLNKARQMYDPTLNTNIANQNSELNTGLANYDTQINTVNTNTQNSIADINKSTTGTQNQYSNNMLGRGMGRSTLVTTGLAGIANQGTENIQKVNTAKDTQLNEIEALKNTLRQNIASKINALKSDYETGVQSYANQLMQTDQQREDQLNAQRIAQEQWQKQFDADQAYKKQQLAISASKSSGGSTGKKGSGSSNNANYSEYAWSDYKSFGDDLGSAERWINDSSVAAQIKKSAGNEVYQQILNDIKVRNQRMNANYARQNTYADGSTGAGVRTSSGYGRMLE